MEIIMTGNELSTLKETLVMINHDLKWNKKHLNSIKHSYSSSNYYDEIISFVEEHYNKMHESLANFNQELIKHFTQCQF